MLFSTCFTLRVVPFLPRRGPIHDGARESSMEPDASKHLHQYFPPAIDFLYYTIVVVVVYRKIKTRLDLLSIPQSGGKISKRLGGIKGCKYKTSSWHLNEFPDGNNTGSTV